MPRKAQQSRRSPESERLIQSAIFAHIAWRKNPGWLFWHVPNEGKRSPWVGADLKRQGLLPGVGDVSIVSPTGRYHEIEVKAPGGRVTQAQQTRQEQLKASGVICATAYGLDAALAILEDWGAIR